MLCFSRSWISLAWGHPSQGRGDVWPLPDTDQLILLAFRDCKSRVINTRPVGWGLQIPIQVSDIAPTPHKGDGHDQQAEVAEMVPVKALFQGLKKVVQAGGNAYDAEHGAILLLPLAGGRWVHLFSIYGGLPRPPLLSSP